MKLREAQSLFAVDLARLILYCKEQNVEVTIGEVLRTKEQQEIYLKQGLSKTRNSQHLKKLAADLYFFENGKLLSKPLQMLHIANYWSGLSKANRWGGDWNQNGNSKDESFQDLAHFERVY